MRRGYLEKEEMDGWMKWEHSGFSLHASVALDADDRPGLDCFGLYYEIEDVLARSREIEEKFRGWLGSDKYQEVFIDRR